MLSQSFGISPKLAQNSWNEDQKQYHNQVGFVSGTNKSFPPLLAQSPAFNLISKEFQESRSPSSFTHGHCKD